MANRRKSKQESNFIKFVRRMVAIGSLIIAVAQFLDTRD